MANVEKSSESYGKVEEERERLEVLDSGMPRVTSPVSISFPATISHIVGEYLSNSKRRYFLETLLAGVQPIALCLTQDVELSLASCWSLGFLPPEQPWQSVDVKVDKQYLIKDSKGCLRFLRQRNSSFCPMVVEVLVVNLSKTLGSIRSALNDLLHTIQVLHNHLNNVKHVVISIEKYASCYFSFKDAIDDATGLCQPVDRLKALSEIVLDLDACCIEKTTLTAKNLLVFFFKANANRASEAYLEKFIIELDHPLGLLLSKEIAYSMPSNKIMWVCSLRCLDDFLKSEKRTIQMCCAIYVDAPDLRSDQVFKHVFCYEDNPTIERIVVKSKYLGLRVQLPRPRAPLTPFAPLSALMELTLEGDLAIHLTQLNSGYFQNLERLYVVGGEVTGHLDSRYVPRLRILVIEPGKKVEQSYACVRPRVRQRCQSLIGSGRPWQLVVFCQQRGWSFASYDEPIADSQEDGKESLSHFPRHRMPFIKELLLVSHCQEDVEDWQLQLAGYYPSVEAVPQDDRCQLLVWAPERVEEIAVFGAEMEDPWFKFNEEIPGRVRILSSLTFHDVKAKLDGAALPHLQSLEVNSSSVELSGAFPHLRTLSLKGPLLDSPWHVEAPSLEFLLCDMLSSGKNLSLRPQLLPRLSFLQITSCRDDLSFCPEFLLDGEELGLSHVKYVVFDSKMALSPFFNQFQLQHVLHLDLSMNASQLPTSWSGNTEWLCETLTVNISGLDHLRMDRMDTPAVVVLPPLPRVRKVTVTEKYCRVLLDSEMLELTECTVPSPTSLGPQLKCPALTRILFTGDLSESDKEKCLDPATYEVIGAQPQEVIFSADYQLHTMTWKIAPNVNEKVPDGWPLEKFNDAIFFSYFV